jgi:hypothetical protein
MIVLTFISLSTIALDMTLSRVHLIYSNDLGAATLSLWDQEFELGRGTPDK